MQIPPSGGSIPDLTWFLPRSCPVRRVSTHLCVCVSSLQSFHLRVCVHVCVWRGVDLEKVAFPLGLTVLQRGSEITVLVLVKLLLIH